MALFASETPDLEAEATGVTRVAMVEGSSPKLSGETDLLRRTRLRAAAGFLIAYLTVFLVWRVAFAQPDLWPLNVVIIVGIAAASAFLYDPHPATHGRLKAIELAIFGLMIVYLAVRQHHMMLLDARVGGDLHGAARGSMITAITLMFVYAMLIPNTWRSAARVIVPISIMPSAVKVFAAATHPAIFRTILDTASVEIITENLAYMIVAATLAIYGTHVINSLRAEAFDAKQLNQYRLVEPLGSGGMGDVYLAEHRLMKRPCALKLIRRERAEDPRAITRFEREVRATSRLSHPNTVEIYDYGRTEDGTFYYVMEYLPGLSLQALVEESGPMPPGRAIYLLRQVCGALAEAHASGLIHRDLKPANIIASERGGRHDFVKILDFGLVRDLTAGEVDGDSAQNRGAQGTPLYMAPEQVECRPDADHRLDLYALGCVAYVLVTGRPPFDHETRLAVMLAHTREVVVPPSRHRPDLPADLEAVILRCLSKRPDDRYADADEVEAALAACAAAPDWDDREAARWWRERRGVAAAAT
jgi:tRNA A-37 threonylcarbamoyl transferase component Bud32